MTRRAGFAAIGAVVLSLAIAVAVGMSSGDRESAVAQGEPLTYVSVGASDSVGVGAGNPATDAWPVVFARESLPAGSTHVNVAVSGSKAAEALAVQVPKAIAVDPDVVTVWLNVNDLRAFVSPATYEQQLRELVVKLRRGGDTEVLVANTPEIDQLPVIKNLGVPVPLVESRVDEYNAVIEEVVDDTGAVLVDLHEQSERFEEEGRIASLTSADGFHPNTTGYREVARVFGEAFEDIT